MPKLKGGIFLSVKDLMILSGNKHYQNAWRELRTILDGFGSDKRKITVKEYCHYEGIDFTEVTEYLNQYR